MNQDDKNEIRQSIATTLIARVTSVNSTTINCQPVINKTLMVNDEKQTIAFPEFVDVPVIWAQGGGSHTTYPIKTGDYCILFVIERSIDHFIAGIDHTEPAENRSHDYSDSVALMGICNARGAFTIPDRTTTSGDYLFKDNVIIEQNLVVKLNVTIEGNLAVQGSMHSTGDITTDADIKAGSISLQSHVHGGVAEGGADTEVSK